MTVKWKESGLVFVSVETTVDGKSIDLIIKSGITESYLLWESIEFEKLHGFQMGVQSIDYCEPFGE